MSVGVISRDELSGFRRGAIDNVGYLVWAGFIYEGVAVNWNPYPETKPPKHDLYLVTDDIGVGVNSWEDSWMQESLTDGLIENPYVVAWMPLPKPYEPA